MDKNENETMVPYYFHTNAINTTTAVTDQNGNIVERYSYDIYGMPIIKNVNGDVISQSAIGNEYMFHGRRYDKETNLYYFRARYYDPIIGRFLQTDPMGYKDSMNLYQAFNMNPVNFVDPFGDKIYLTGMFPRRDLMTLLQVFIDIGVNEDELKNAINIDIDEKGVYITQDSYIPSSKKWDLDKSRLSDDFLLNTTNLQNNIKNILKRLEKIFTVLITSDIIIEFSIDNKAFKTWIDASKYGRGVCIDPEHELKKSSKNPSKGTKNIQVIVDPNPTDQRYLINNEFQIDLRGHKAGIEFSKNEYWAIPLTLEAAIVHEFGHAYALLMGHKPNNSHTSMNAEIAVLLENLYRLRANRKIHKGRPREHKFVRRYH